MSRKKVTRADKKPDMRIPKKYILTIGAVLVICIAVIAGLVLTKQGPWAPPGVPTNATANATTSFDSAGALYSKSVDLANAGNYQDALTDADEALALNVSSLVPVIQSNRAGILVELGRYNDAIDAADVAIDAPGNLTTLRAIAYYNKAHALQGLNMTADAAAAFANASALDPSHKFVPDHL